jgi:hypothetical protein
MSTALLEQCHFLYLRMYAHTYYFSLVYYRIMPIPVALPSKVYVCCRLVAGTEGSNSVEVMDVILLCLLCVM